MQENQSSTRSKRIVVGLPTSQAIAGYAVSNVATVKKMSRGRRPILSEMAPPIGSQMKFERPTKNVTSRLWRLLKAGPSRPNVGV